MSTQNTILDVPSVKSDPLRQQYIGRTLNVDEKAPIGPTGGVMHTIQAGSGLYFWPNEIKPA